MKCNTVGCKKEATFHAECQMKIKGVRADKKDVHTCEVHTPEVAANKKVGDFYGFQNIPIYKIVAR